MRIRVRWSGPAPPAACAKLSTAGGPVRDGGGVMAVWSRDGGD